MKICSNPECHLKGKLQPFDSFHKNAITKDGRVAECKKCLLEKYLQSMEEMTTESLLERVKGMNSLEILPPQDIGENRKEVVGISVNHKTKTLSIVVHTEPKERPSGFQPEDQKIVTFSFNQLMWLSPRLEGYRSFLGIENGYEKHG